MFSYHTIRRRNVQRVASALTIAICCLGGRAYAEQVIVTPSPTTLAPKQISGEAMIGLDHGTPQNYWVNAMSNLVEYQVAHFAEPGRQGTALSAEVPIIPETSEAPAVSAGIQDVFNTAKHFRDVGYSGRSLYLVAGETLQRTLDSPFPLHNTTVSVGLGTGVSRAVFGSASADLFLGLRQTFEFDGRALNYRVERDFGPIVHIEYDRLHGANYIGIGLRSPAGL